MRRIEDVHSPPVPASTLSVISSQENTSRKRSICICQIKKWVLEYISHCQISKQAPYAENRNCVFARAVIEGQDQKNPVGSIVGPKKPRGHFHQYSRYPPCYRRSTLIRKNSLRKYGIGTQEHSKNHISCTWM